MKGWKHEPVRHSLSSQGINTAFGQSKIRDFEHQIRDEPPEELMLAESDYYDQNMDEIIKLFWWCSINDDWTHFQYDRAFDVMEEIIHEKLGSHLYLPPDEQKEYFEENFSVSNGKKMFSSDVFFKAYMGSHKEQAIEIYERFMTDEWKNKIDMEKVRRLIPLKDDEWLEDVWYRMAFFDNQLLPLAKENDEFRERLFTVLANADINPDEFEKDSQGKYDALRKSYERVRDRKAITRRQDKFTLFDSIVGLMHHRGSLFSDYLGDCENMDELREDFREEYP